MPRHPLRVLIIDDNPRDRAATKTMLQRSSFAYVVQEASHPRAAIRSLAKFHPHCVLFEPWFEGTVATDELQRLKTKMNGNPVPVIVWTALSLPPLHRAAIQHLGATGWLLKRRTGSRELDIAIRATVAAA